MIYNFLYFKRANSIFKFIELDCKYSLISSYQNIIELGCFPGSWSQYIISKILYLNLCSKLFCVDRKVMIKMNNLTFINGNFISYDVIKRLFLKINNKKADLIISDMCPILGFGNHYNKNKYISLIKNIFIFSFLFLKRHGKLLFKLFFLDRVLFRTWFSYFGKTKFINLSNSKTGTSEGFFLCYNFKYDV